jgi:hypothetical protein
MFFYFSNEIVNNSQQVNNLSHIFKMIVSQYYVCRKCMLFIQVVYMSIHNNLFVAIYNFNPVIAQIKESEEEQKETKSILPLLRFIRILSFD